MTRLWTIAARSLRSSPMFTAVVVVTLAVGIAANTVIFSAARAVFLRALPYPDADRLAFRLARLPGVPAGNIGGSAERTDVCEARRRSRRDRETPHPVDHGHQQRTTRQRVLRWLGRILLHG